jgi:hypothetical protein
MNRSYLNHTLDMLNFQPGVRASVSWLLLPAMILIFAASALSQTTDFTMSASALDPSSVLPGGESLSTISLATTSTTPITVALTCTVSPAAMNGATCSIGSSATAPGQAFLTINVPSASPASTYQVTVTGTDSSGTESVIVNLPVLAVTPAYTLNVTTPVAPGSVHAGSGATAGITVTSINGYEGNVTLSCSAIAPSVTLPPVCSFTPPTVAVPGSGSQTSTLNLNTIGPTASIRNGPTFYALWLPVIGTTLITAFHSRSRRYRASFLLLCAVAIALMPACGSSSSSSGTSNNSSNGNLTPNNTYTFTISGGDANGVGPSNTLPTLTLTVD